jgi:hypothetical protein
MKSGSSLACQAVIERGTGDVSDMSDLLAIPAAQGGGCGKESPNAGAPATTPHSTRPMRGGA